MTTQVKLDIKELPNISQAELKARLTQILNQNWSSAFCNRGIDNAKVNEIASDIEARGGYSNTQEFLQMLATELWSLPQKESRQGANSKPRQPRNSKVTTTKLPKKEAIKTQLLPSAEVAKLVATLHIQQDDLKEVIDKHDFKTAETLQTQLDSTQEELKDMLAPYVTQEQSIASTTQEVDDLEHKVTLARRHYKEVIQQLASLRIEAVNAEREANVLEQNLDNRKAELAKLKAGQYSLSDSYVTLDLETGVIHGTQLVHMPSDMVQTLDNLRGYLENAEAINADVFVQKDRLTQLRTLKATYANLGMPMPADVQKELDKIERGYQRWLNAK